MRSNVPLRASQSGARKIYLAHNLIASNISTWNATTNPPPTGSCWTTNYALPCIRARWR
ncbi:hypothetical protein CBM2585_B50004 [Cupriavidus taiwanensis]|nr:hypothetical protein CBM2585_B50004 [Cupriavidus taiwanensis]